VTPAKPADRIIAPAENKTDKSAGKLARPSAPKPPATKPPATKPPATKPPKVKPSATKPPATKPPAGKPSAAKPATPQPAGAGQAQSDDRSLAILMVVSEAHPFATTGGLAEVAGALPAALGRLGHTVTLVVPRYRGMDAGDPLPEAATFQLGGRIERVLFHQRPLHARVTAVLVDAPELFDREGLYNSGGVDFHDNARRFAVLSRAALEYARLRGERPSIIHAHDWQTGLVPVYQKMHFADDPILGGVPVVFTIHNLAFQGVFPSWTLPAIGLGWEVFTMDALEYWGQISYLKGGINFAERITTVSPTYAQEILTPAMGFGLEGSLRRRAATPGVFSGILNGIDVGRWDPTIDSYLPAPYGAHDLAGKARGKQLLLETVGLGSDPVTLSRPVIGIVSRLSDQKGFDLIASAIEPLMALDATWVMLGSGERHYEAGWRALASHFPERVSATIGFNERLAHLIEGGADIFLMPSRFEPCGLNQMYSLRYGTVPVVRATGGLEDTIIDVADHPDTGNGFKFRDYSPVALVSTLQRAIDTFRNPSAWKTIQLNGMKENHSWDVSAREYVKVYRQAATRPEKG